MIEFFQALTQHAFLQTALLAGLLASVGCGVMGTFVVVKRIGYLAGGISHAVLGGMGAALFLGFSPLAGAIVAAIVAALIIGWVKLHWHEQEDTLIGAVWAIGMAAGVMFISQVPGYQTDLMSYLFGNILLVSGHDMIMMLALDIVLLTLVLLFYRQFIAVAFDEEFASLRGVPVKFFYLLLLCLVAITVVLLIQIVGLILVIALLTLPAAIAGQYVHTLIKMMLLAIALGSVFTTAGLALSYSPDLPAGATIILVAGASYVFSAIFTQWRQYSKTQKAIAKNA